MGCRKSAAQGVNMRYQAAIFDMDGTILNTAEDLTDALNWALDASERRADYTVDQVRQFFGSGAHVAIERALAVENGMEMEDLEEIGASDSDSGKVWSAQLLARYDVRESEVNHIQELFTPYYAEHCDIKTGPYPGIPEAIRDLRKAGLKTAVVSNKPDVAVQKLAADIFPGLFDVSIGEMPGVRRKPAPDMTLRALALLGVNREGAVYIGDSEVDMMTAANAGLPCISVSWGFRGRRFLEEHKASCIVDSAAEMAEEIVRHGYEIKE